MIELTARQKEIIEIVQTHAPVSGEQIAEMLKVSKPTLRSDLAVLVMLGFIDAKPKVGYFPGTVLKPEHMVISQINEMKVREIQSVPITLPGTATVHEAVITMFLENVGSLIVVETDYTLCGIVSRKDLLKVTLGNPSAPAMPISLVMTRHPNIVTISPDDTVVDAARKMIHHEIDSLPVVIQSSGENGPERLEVVGRITKTNMTRVLLELASSI